MGSKAESTVLPTDDPVPSSTPNPTAKASAVPVSAALAAAPAHLDASLAHLERCMQTPAGIDFVCYTSRLSAAVLTSLSETALRRSARKLVALALALPPRTAVVFAPTTSPGPVTATSAKALLLAQRLRALSGLLSEARVIFRLWSLLGMYFWARRLFLALIRSVRASGGSELTGAVASPAATPLSASVVLDWAQLVSSVLFQALENGAYLSSKGVLGWDVATQERAMRWSSRFWGAFVGIELGKQAVQATRGAAEVRTPAWRKTVARNLAWSPLIVHWSSEKGFISEMGVGLLACIPSIIQMRDLWANTAAP